MDTQERGKIYQRVVLLTLSANVFLTLLKGIAGFKAGSSALVADTFHSGGDIVASSVILLGLCLASKPPDKCHHYGHEKIEFVLTALVSLLLLYIAYELISVTINEKIMLNVTRVPDVMALWVSAVCMIIKEAMFRFTVYRGQKLNSTALLADAWHHRTDAFILGGIFIGVGGSRLGYPLMDYLVGLVIAVLIIIMALRLGKSSLQGLIDTAPEQEKMKAISSVIQGVRGVEELHKLRGRSTGICTYLEAKIGVDAGISVQEGHEIAREIKTCVQRAFPEIVDLTIHLNPVGK